MYQKLLKKNSAKGLLSYKKVRRTFRLLETQRCMYCCACVRFNLHLIFVRISWDKVV